MTPPPKPADGPPPEPGGAALRRSPLARYGALVWIGSIMVASGIAVWVTRGEAAFQHALETSFRLFLTLLPVMGAGMLMAGFTRALLPSGLVEKWLGEGSGLRGLVIATVAGTLTPGGPPTAFPLVIVLAGAGADKGCLIAYVSSWSVNGVHRVLIWELPLLGPHFALLRFLASVPLGVIAGLIARRVPIPLVVPDAPPAAGAPPALTEHRR